jgi:hypothetical protein
MFPKLKACVRFPHGRPECSCVMHNTIAPEGLNWARCWNYPILEKLFPKLRRRSPKSSPREVHGAVMSKKSSAGF